MRQLYNSGAIHSETLVWTEAFTGGWVAVGSAECSSLLRLQPY